MTYFGHSAMQLIEIWFFLVSLDVLLGLLFLLFNGERFATNRRCKSINVE